MLEVEFQGNRMWDTQLKKLISLPSEEFELTANSLGAQMKLTVASFLGHSVNSQDELKL